jgi:hypothetical protein
MGMFVGNDRRAIMGTLAAFKCKSSLSRRIVAVEGGHTCLGGVERTPAAVTCDDNGIEVACARPSEGEYDIKVCVPTV